jgi:hypothetical protein
MGLQSSSHFQSAAGRHRRFVTGWQVIVLLAVVSLPRLFWKRPGLFVPSKQLGEWEMKQLIPVPITLKTVV